MDYQALAALLFPNVTDTPEALEEKYPLRLLPEGAVVTRMAPSPTGFVHLGNLVMAKTLPTLISTFIKSSKGISAGVSGCGGAD